MIWGTRSARSCSMGPPACPSAGSSRSEAGGAWVGGVCPSTLRTNKDFSFQGCQPGTKSTKTSARSQYWRVSHPYGNTARQPPSNTILTQTHLETSLQLLSNNNNKKIPPTSVIPILQQPPTISISACSQPHRWLQTLLEASQKVGPHPRHTNR